MAIAINSRNHRPHATYSAAFVVPAAAVWDGSSPMGAEGVPATRAPHVRTLRVEGNRTERRSSVRTSPSKRRPYEELEPDLKSNTSSYFAGSIFGAAMIIGTLLAGSFGDEAPQPSTDSVAVESVATVR